MSIDFKVVMALSDPLIKGVFENILRYRTVSRYQLELQEPESTRGSVQKALDSLQSEGLIERVAGQSMEKDMFYPSGSGLIAEKFIK